MVTLGSPGRGEPVISARYLVGMAEHALTELVVDLLVDGGYLRRCPRHKAVVLDDGDGGSCEDVAAALRPAERLRFDSREHLELAIQGAVAMASQHCLLCIRISDV